MMRRRLMLALVLMIGSLAAASVPPAVMSSPAQLPSRLTDEEFWRLSSAFSEEGGTFHSDNFVSNEGRFQLVIPDLMRRAHQGGFYMGVGPEQNFTYMVAVRPRMAFILDIRRGNLHEHLLYKALMEMSADRAEFAARLFSRERPAGLGPTSSAEQLFAAFESQRPTVERYRANLKAVFDWLTVTRHRLPLVKADFDGIDYVFRTAFFADGPDLNYQLLGQQGRGGRGGGNPTYAQLMAMEDGAGQQRSYLASEQNFAFLRDLQSKNLVVPVVGDFGGPKALRAIGKYARDNGAMVSAFYLSNVEQYLRQDGKWEAFCANVATLPLDASSTFIRSVRGGVGGPADRTSNGRSTGFGMFRSSLGNMQDETRACAPGSPRPNGRATLR